MGFSFTTFVFETINFVVLMWLLSRLVYRPLREGIERREQEIATRERAAAEAEEAANAERIELRTRIEGAERARLETIREATEQAARERAHVLQLAREDAAAERARAMRLLEAERKAADSWVREIAVARGAQVAGRLLMDLAPEAMEEALFSRLLVSIETGDALQALEDVDGERAPLQVEVTGSRMLAREAVERLRKVIESKVQRDVRLVLREDPELGAGVTLRLEHVVLDASVAGQLAAFRKHAAELVEREANAS